MTWRSFDTLAPLYRLWETMLAGSLLQRCRLIHLSAAAGGREALLLGEGPGRFLPELLRSQPNLRVVCVEQSAAMIRIARKQLSPAEQTRVTFVPQEALAWLTASAAAGRTFDLVATHFFLDCFPPDQLTQLVHAVAARVQPGARWLLTDFHLPPRGWRRWRAQAVVWLMYRTFRILTSLPAARLTPPDEALRHAGFRLASRHDANFGLLQADCWVFADQPTTD